jgi:hypothetical protein
VGAKAVVDPIRSWNWQRHLMFVVAVIGVTIRVIATKHSPWPVVVVAVGLALLVAVFVRLISWILPERPPFDIYVPEQVMLAAGASLLGLGILAQRL